MTSKIILRNLIQMQERLYHAYDVAMFSGKSCDNFDICILLVLLHSQQ